MKVVLAYPYKNRGRRSVIQIRNEVIRLLHSSHFTPEEKVMIRELKNKIRIEADTQEKKELERQLNTIMEKAFIKKQLLRRKEL